MRQLGHDAHDSLCRLDPGRLPHAEVQQMMKRFFGLRGAAVALALALAAPAGAQAQVQQGSVVEDLLRRAQDAYNDLNYLRADTLAQQVLQSTGRVSAQQRTRAMTIIAAAAYPDEPSAQRRAASLTMLRQLVRMNL